MQPEVHVMALVFVWTGSRTCSGPLDDEPRDSQLMLRNIGMVRRVYFPRRGSAISRMLETRDNLVCNTE